MTPQEVLALPMQPNDSGATTIRGYLLALLKELWLNGEGFSAKLPFGNSGWEWDMYEPLIKAGLIEGTFDEDGYLEDCDDKTGYELIVKAIEAL